mmetsp:Transcript_38242/g.74845  ORF Transcript_38242/g.74845 Transcript_38242/m.74845 type:complete len:99 (+) Transcript_38242:2-298(+)
MRPLTAATTTSPAVCSFLVLGLRYLHNIAETAPRPRQDERKIVDNHLVGEGDPVAQMGESDSARRNKNPTRCTPPAPRLKKKQWQGTEKEMMETKHSL